MNTKIHRQCLAILDSNGLSWTQRGSDYSLRFSSAQLNIGLASIGEQNLLTLRAPVLREVPIESQSDAILAALNCLNCESHFGKWALYEAERVIALEYDLLGDHLQENELMTALATLARLADQQDDLLQQQFGGLRAFEDS
jgi:Putative bacterial sensory transduction regulator